VAQWCTFSNPDSYADSHTYSYSDGDTHSRSHGHPVADANTNSYKCRSDQY
jgi:hypothetical protein